MGVSQTVLYTGQFDSRTFGANRDPAFSGAILQLDGSKDGRSQAGRRRRVPAANGSTLLATGSVMRRTTKASVPLRTTASTPCGLSSRSSPTRARTWSCRYAAAKLSACFLAPSAFQKTAPRGGAPALAMSFPTLHSLLQCMQSENATDQDNVWSAVLCEARSEDRLRWWLHQAPARWKVRCTHVTLLPYGSFSAVARECTVKQALMLKGLC